MIIQLLVLEIKLYDTFSLKGKRSIIKSIVEKLRGKFNASVVESGYQESYQRSQISIVFLAPDTQLANSTADNIINYSDNHLEGEIVKITREFI